MLLRINALRRLQEIESQRRRTKLRSARRERPAVPIIAMNLAIAGTSIIGHAALSLLRLLTRRFGSSRAEAGG